MTIREKIIENEITAIETRTAQLKAIGAPAIVIESSEKSIAELKSGKLQISGETALLDEEYVTGEVKKGRGGKVYITINGTINYFPNARYGRYIAIAK